ncbi:M-phase inducer phosphatase-like isoform X2 [Cloeon dipterum]
MDLQPKEVLKRQFQNYLEIADSPAPPSPAGKSFAFPIDLSPMSMLAQNMGSANLEDPDLRRRLSLSSMCDTPSPLSVSQRKSKILTQNTSQDEAISTPSIFRTSAKISSPGSPLRARECNQLSPGGIKNKENHSTADFLLKDTSQDSVLDDPASSFKFTQPAIVAKLRQDVAPISPHSNFKFFRSLSSGSESIDDGFLDFLNSDKEDEPMSPNAPSGISNLLKGHIHGDSPKRSMSGPSSAKRSLIRSLSSNDFDTPPTSKVRQNLFKSPSLEVIHDPMEVVGPNSFAFKRPVPPSDSDSCIDSPFQPAAKKRRTFTPANPLRENSNSLPPNNNALTQSSLLNYGFQKSKSPAIDKFKRSFSDTDAIIKNSVERSYADSMLIGDFSKPYVLPLMNGKHQDLKTISSETLAGLLSGQFNLDQIVFRVVDCRYPYEYAGGHIRGAINLFSKDLIEEEFITKCRLPSASSEQRHILIFHCEFSSERAPCLSRYLRGCDRAANKECYPNLFYPEMYLLHGGYKAFFESHPELCEPQSYTPMLNQGNEADLKHFRSKSRSWAGDVKSIPNSRLMPSKFSLKRLDV